jgi:sRNA-binding protein
MKTAQAKYHLELGAWEFPERIALLRTHFPKAFPANDSDIRPLVMKGPTPAIMAAFGWTNAYASGVLNRWKSRHAYATALLRHRERIGIGGIVVAGETVTDAEREQAREQLKRPEPVPTAAPVAPPDRHRLGDPAVAAAKKAEHLRGRKTAREHLPALREKWPAAFPDDERDVRPLAAATAAIAQAMGWDPSFTHGILAVWKSRASYCKAVLCYNERINLDGSPSGVMVDDKARAMATAQLAAIKAKRQKQAAEPAAVKAPVEPVPPIKPPKASPPPPPPPPPMIVLETPEQIRAHLRASLLKRRAASAES